MTLMKKIIVPKTISRHIEEELKNNPEFRKAYNKEIDISFRKRAKLVKINLPSLLIKL